MPAPDIKSVLLSSLNRMRSLCVAPHGELPNVKGDRMRQLHHHFTLGLEMARGLDNPAVASGLLRFEPLFPDLIEDDEYRIILEDELELFIAQIDSMRPEELYRSNGNGA